MAELEQSFSSNSMVMAAASVEADLSNSLPPWSEAKASQRLHLFFLYSLICLPVGVLLFVVLGGYSLYVSLYIYHLIADNSDRPELYYWHDRDEHNQAKAKGYVLLSIQSVALFMLLISHMRAMFTDPGSIPETHQWGLPSDNNSESSDENTKLAERSKKGSARQCNHCIRKKPDRAHHCRQCNRCNLKMDHHCNWIANCVGYYNYKYFFLMVLYGSILLGVFISTFWECVVVTLNDSDSSTFLCLIVVLSYSLISMLGFAVIGFCFFHIWLMYNNYTTIEYCEKKRKDVPGYTRSPFSKNSMYKNFKDALGDNPLIWLLPLSYREPDTGFYFKS